MPNRYRTIVSNLVNRLPHPGVLQYLKIFGRVIRYPVDVLWTLAQFPKREQELVVAPNVFQALHCRLVMERKIRDK